MPANAPAPNQNPTDRRDHDPLLADALRNRGGITFLVNSHGLPRFMSAKEFARRTGRHHTAALGRILNTFTEHGLIMIRLPPPGTLTGPAYYVGLTALGVEVARQVKRLNTTLTNAAKRRGTPMTPRREVDEARDDSGGNGE